MDIKIRNIRPDEVEIRKKGTSKDGKWTTWLLYKTARVDSAILTEAFGLFGWQNKFERVGNTLFCSIGVLDKDTNEWVWKTDAGDETQVEAVKGEASDAFKRAGFKWGIGAQLYNAPKIILDSKYNYVDIKEIEIDDDKVTKLTLECKGEEVFWYPHRHEPKASVKTVEVTAEEPVFSDPQYQRLLASAKALNVDFEGVKTHMTKMKIAFESNGDIPGYILEQAIKKKKDKIEKEQTLNAVKEKLEATDVSSKH